MNKSLWIACLIVGSAVSVHGSAQQLPPPEKMPIVQKGGLSATVIDFSSPRRRTGSKPHEQGQRATWEETRVGCAALKLMGGGWRLPNREEVRRVSVYENRELLPEGYGDLGVCDISVWIDESEPGYVPGERQGFFYCHTSYNGRHMFEAYGDRRLAMCVRDGKPTAPIVVKEETKTPPRMDVTNQLLTRAPDPQKDIDAQAATRLQSDREYAKVRAAKEQQVAKENAERQLVAFDRELKYRQQCALPHNQGSCNCGKYQAQPPGGRKTCDK